jgi:hypothetical protein
MPTHFPHGGMIAHNFLKNQFPINLGYTENLGEFIFHSGADYDNASNARWGCTRGKAQASGAYHFMA